MAVKFSNNAKTTLASAVSSSATSISVSDASAFPTLAAGDHTYATLVQVASLTTLEIVKVTAISGTTLTVVRAQQGTSAISFSAADLCELRVTSGLVQDALDEKVDDSQVLTNVPSGALFTDTVYSLPFTDNSANWDTAHGWGNHASAGYLTSYTDTNTTYSAGTGVTLTGTTFSLTDTNAKLNLVGGTLTGDLQGVNIYGGSSGTIATGVGYGSVGMTINDGQGNANVTFNHIDGVADQAGNVARIVVNTDSTSGAKMTFEVADNAAAGAVDSGGALFTISSSGSITAIGNITAYSDERIKDNIETIDSALEKVTQMRGVFYNRNDLGEEENAVRRTGVVAQEVEKILPEVVRENEEKDVDDSGNTLEGGRKRLTVDYGNMVGLLIEAIKEQQEQIDSVKQILDELKNGTSE